MVTLALDESDGILEYDVSLAQSTATVEFDPLAVTSDGILAAITRRTGYENMVVEPLV
jgi:copper chaperone CopZ